MFVTTGRPQIAHAGTKRGPRRGRGGGGARLNVCPLPVQGESSGRGSRAALGRGGAASLGGGGVVEHARARAGRAGERHRQGRTRLAVRLVPVGDRVDLTRLRAVPERREEAPAVAPRADADPLETKRREEGHATLAVLG